MAIRPEFYVNLKGKDYPLYAGVLIAATEAGLKSLTTELVQVPTDANGQMAIVKARAEFEDGRVFEDYGDASPKNCPPMIAAAAVRMASTRAKGRTLRDAIGLGEMLKEELGMDDETPAAIRTYPTENAPRDRPHAPANGDDAASVCVISGCGELLNKNQALLSKTKFGKPLCLLHQKEELSGRPA